MEICQMWEDSTLFIQKIPGHLLSKHLEFSSEQLKFKRKSAIYIKLVRNEFVMHICSPTMW